MPLRVTDYENDSRDNDHVLKIWAQKLKEFFPQITAIQKDPTSGRRLVVEIAPSNQKDRWTNDEVIRRTIEIHTESAFNYNTYFLPRKRIAIQHFEREIDRVYGDASIYRTTADLFFHGFRNRDPAVDADDILSPFFFWTKTLKNFMNNLMLKNFDEPKKPTYYLPHREESKIKYYDGFRVGSWKTLTPVEIQTGKYRGDLGKFIDIDWSKTMKTKEGRTKIFYTTIGILMPVRDIKHLMTLTPFAPGLENFVP